MAETELGVVEDTLLLSSGRNGRGTPRPLLNLHFHQTLTVGVPTLPFETPLMVQVSDDKDQHTDVCKDVAETRSPSNTHCTPSISTEGTPQDSHDSLFRRETRLRHRGRRPSSPSPVECRHEGWPLTGSVGTTSNTGEGYWLTTNLYFRSDEQSEILVNLSGRVDVSRTILPGPRVYVGVPTSEKEWGDGQSGEMST